MELPHLDESAVRRLATHHAFNRGREYYESGWVSSLIRRGPTYYAEVQGSDYDPYQVTFTLATAEDDATTPIGDTHCTCPYAWDGLCKHVIAALLTYVHRPEMVEERPTIDVLLDSLDADQVKQILRQLVESQPAVIHFIESRMPQPPKQPPSPAPADHSQSAGGESILIPRNQTNLSFTPFRQQVRATLHELDHMRPAQEYAQVAGLVEQLYELLNQARVLIGAGYGRSALLILEALTEEYVAKWYDLDGGNGERGDFFAELGQPLAEALLSADLTAAERQEWAERLANWQAEVAYYGVDDAFDLALAAAEQGWRHLPLLHVLQGESAAQYGPDEERPWYADELAQARLNVLARQGRYQEYLYLARAENQVEQYLTMLVQMGRVQEAIAYGLNRLTTAAPALALARALHEKGEVDAALRVAERGLSLQQELGSRYALLLWLRDAAQEAGQSDLARRMAAHAFREQPTLANYQTAHALAGSDWPPLREELLDYLRRATLFAAQNRIDIFLYEELPADAIQALDAEPHPHPSLVERVAEAVTATHPEWVIRACRRQAEALLSQGAESQEDAIYTLLNRTRQAYTAAGRAAEWPVYLNQLMAHFGHYDTLFNRLYTAP
jgi:uncharacterized Zn finger protein